MPQSAIVRQTRWIELADALLALVRAHLAVEILVGHHVGGQLAPGGGHFAVVLLEQHLAPFALDGGGAKLPLDRGERVGPVVGTKHGRDVRAPRRALWRSSAVGCSAIMADAPVASCSGLSMARFLIPLGL